MNERIFELADQAAEGMAGLNTPDEFCKKFAELIVRECAEVAYKRSVHSCPSDIFKHFGVEE